MDQLTTEVLKAIDDLKKTERPDKVHTNDTVELLLIASLLEEENLSAAS